MIIRHIITEVVNMPPKKSNRQKCACNLFFEAFMKICRNYHRHTAFWATVYNVEVRYQFSVTVAILQTNQYNVMLSESMTSINKLLPDQIRFQWTVDVANRFV